MKLITKADFYDHLRLALRENAKCEVRFYEAIEIPNDSFSESFSQRLEEIKAIAQKRTRTLSIRRIITVIAAAALIIATLSACVYGEEILEFVKDFGERNLGLSFSTNDPQTIEEKMGVIDPPGDFKLVSENGSDVSIFTVWSDGSRTYTFTQISRANFDQSIDTENNYHVKYINENEVFFAGKNGYMGATWTDGKYAYTLYCLPGFTWDELYEMVANVGPIEED